MCRRRLATLPGGINWWLSPFEMAPPGSTATCYTATKKGDTYPLVCSSVAATRAEDTGDTSVARAANASCSSPLLGTRAHDYQVFPLSDIRYIFRSGSYAFFCFRVSSSFLVSRIFFSNPFSVSNFLRFLFEQLLN